MGETEEKSFKLNIVTPEREFFSGEVQSLVVNTVSGEMGILYRTLPLVTVLQSGIMKIRRNGRWMEAANSYGFVSVLKDGVTVLTQSCEWPHEIDADIIDKEICELQERERKAKSAYEYKMAKAQLAAQFAKLKLKNKSD